MAAVTSPADVVSRLGRQLTADEVALVSVLIDDAENLIRVQLPGRVMNAGTVDLDLVPQVVSAAVIRVLRNPDGYRSEGAGGISYTLDTRVAAGFLTILSEEWTLLGLSTPSSSSGLGCIVPTLGPAYAESYGMPPWL